MCRTNDNNSAKAFVTVSNEELLVVVNDLIIWVMTRKYATNKQTNKTQAQTQPGIAVKMYC